jgi:hypothetical protein
MYATAVHCGAILDDAAIAGLDEGSSGTCTNVYATAAIRVINRADHSIVADLSII